MISLVIAGIGARALMQLTHSSMRFAKAVERISDHSRLSSNLELVFKDAVSCQDAFKVKTATSFANASFSHSAGNLQTASIDAIFLQNASVASVGLSLGDSNVQSILITKKSAGNTIDGTTPVQKEYDAEVQITIKIRDKALGSGTRVVAFLVTLITEMQAGGGETILTCAKPGTTRAITSTTNVVDSKSLCHSIVGGYFDETLNPPQCRILIERRSGDPNAPQLGQIWLRTDL